MADLGKVVITDGANYSASVTYEKLTFVHYQGDAYMTLKTVKGVTPTDDGVNYRLFCKSAELATTSKAGIVLPDGTTTTVDSSGKLSVKKATTSLAGIVKPAATDFTVATDGTQKINTQFTQATTLANIIAGEAIASVLGKVSKAIATTMSLDQNALLKNMLTSIDGNSSEKVPTQAYIHTLVERIGMGTELTAGANLTEVANELSSNLEWKLNGTYKATDTCPLPEKYNELMIKIYRTSDYAYTCGVNILKAELGKNTGNWMTGCGRDATGWDVKIVIAITNTIAINSVFINAADNKSAFSFAVYYR